jgi:integrase
VFGIRGAKDKHDYVNGGHEKWLKRIHAVRLHRLTPQRVNGWKVKYLKAAASNPLKLKQANTTVRSILRSSMSLFAKDVLPHITLKLPKPLPFEGVVLPKAESSRYKSEIDPALLLQKARADLTATNPKTEEPFLDAEAFKVLLLALGAGLRRDEIDTLQWKQILWTQKAIRVETTEYGATKSHTSEADVDVDESLLTLLKELLPKPGEGSPFVIGSRVKPRPSAHTYHHYRCNAVFHRLIVWLRTRGEVKARNPIHTLRKEFGSQVNAIGGIYAASQLLRHSTITLTRDTYVDKKNVIVFPISELLKAAAVGTLEEKKTA